MKAYDGAKPTVGRIVHWYNFDGLSPEMPYPAIIVRVNNDTSVNLWVFPRWIGDEGGCVEPLVEFSENPASGRWTWPPRAAP